MITVPGKSRQPLPELKINAPLKRKRPKEGRKENGRPKLDSQQSPITMQVVDVFAEAGSKGVWGGLSSGRVGMHLTQITRRFVYFESGWI